MNRYQEALYAIPDKIVIDNFKVDFSEERKILQELVDKEIPKKVETEPFYQTGDCPCCKTTVGRLDIYCKYCGQRLDWSEE